MILYCDAVNKFVNSCNGNNQTIVKLIIDKFNEQGFGNKSQSEYNLWIHSLPRVAKALESSLIPQDILYKLED